jgi:hypothetical protein
MKKIFAASLGLALMLSVSARAADEQTLTGKGVCAKCELHKTDKCQSAVQVKDKDGAVVTYYFKANDVSKPFHKSVCQGPVAKVKVSGEVEEKDGQKWIAATKIEKIED